MTTLPSVCESQQVAARALGYTDASWDNLSGDELQPWSSIKSWVHLTESEKAAAVVLGYTAVTWDNVSGAEAQPASSDKEWSGLISCAGGKIPICRPVVVVCSCPCLYLWCVDYSG